MRLADLLLDGPEAASTDRHPPWSPEFSQQVSLPLPLPQPLALPHQVLAAQPQLQPPPLASPDTCSVRVSEDSRSSIDSLLRAASCVSPQQQCQYHHQQLPSIHNSYPMEYSMESFPEASSFPRQKQRLHSVSALAIVEKMHSYIPLSNRHQHQHQPQQQQQHQHQHDRQQSPSRSASRSPSRHQGGSGINFSAHISIPAAAQKFFSSSRNSSPAKGRSGSPCSATDRVTGLTKADAVDLNGLDGDKMEDGQQAKAAGLAPLTQQQYSPAMQRPASFPLISSPTSSSSPPSVVASAVRRGKSVLKALDTRRRDFQCSLCENRFLRKQDMKRHEVTHNQIK
ncbi:hypothetical protein HDU84_001301, partial [Entophlyctis sp. JEL0112]